MTDTGMYLEFPTGGGLPTTRYGAITWEKSTATSEIYSYGSSSVDYLVMKIDSSSTTRFPNLVINSEGNSSSSSLTLQAVRGSNPPCNIQITSGSSADQISLSTDNIFITGSFTNGISFNGTSSDATKVDYYLEGSWTPNVVGTTTTGAVTYSTRQGKFVKIGKIAWIAVEVEWTGGTGAGQLRIRNLPFTVLNGGAFTSCAVYHTNIALPANAVLQAGFLDSTTDIYFATVVTGGGAAGALAYDAAGGLWVSGTYEV